MDFPIKINKKLLFIENRIYLYVCVCVCVCVEVHNLRLIQVPLLKLSTTIRKID